MTDYYAPAVRILTRLHLRNPDVPVVRDVSSSRLDEQKSTIGETLCGEPMYCADLWQLLEMLPGDRVCGACLGEPEGEQEALL